MVDLFIVNLAYYDVQINQKPDDVLNYEVFDVEGTIEVVVFNVFISLVYPILEEII